MGLREWIAGRPNSKHASKDKTRSGEDVTSREDNAERAVSDDFLRSFPQRKDYNAEETYREAIESRVNTLVQDIVKPRRDAQRRLEDHLSELQAAMSDEEDNHTRHVHELKRRHDEHVYRLRCDHGAEVTEVRQQGERDRHHLEAQHNDGVRRLHAGHARAENELKQEVSNLQESLFRAGQEMDSARERHNAAMQSLRMEMGSAHEQHKAKLASLQQDHAQERTRLIKAQTDREEQLLQVQSERENSLLLNHRQEIQHFQSQVTELNTALLQQDDELYTGKLFSTSGLPNMADRKLKDSFTKITAAVDYLGRLEWRPDQRAWSPQDLEARRGPHVLKRVQKAIIQDTIWCLLFDLVFASPFRMFGEQGQVLEGQWLAQSGEHTRADSDSYTWPLPSAQTERWRYMTLTSCREVLSQRLSEFDPRGQVKKGFIEAEEELLRSLKAAIGDVAILDAVTSQKIDQLAKLSRRTWLEFQMHRCRLVTGLTGSRTTRTSQRSNAIRNGPVVLTISPNLRRFGSIKGADLDTVVTIAGCDGESLELS